MKKIILSILLSCSIYLGNAQVLYLQTFDGIPGPTAGGAGTYDFPADMLLRNVDNLTPDAQVSYVNEAWERREDFITNVADSCAFSTSWYSPVGAANDFMWTPAIAIAPGTAPTLTWNANAPDPLYPDGYEVRIMTVPPTGGTGNIGNQLTNSTLIFSISSEASVWTPHSVSLAAYAGQTVYIGFRNNSNNMFLLMIDDIKVESPIAFDAAMSAGVYSEYTILPTSQASIPLGATVNNVGSSALTNVVVTANVYDGTNTLVHTVSSSPIASLAPGGTQTFNFPNYSPTVADAYTITYVHTQNEVDQLATNDALTNIIYIDNFQFSRDNGIVTGALGIGAGNGGYIGQSFTLTNPAYLYSVLAFYNVGYTGEPHACVIWNTTAAGVPNAIIASTDTLNYPNTAPITVTTPISGGTVFLPAGTYVVTAAEFDSTVQLGLTDQIFSLGKNWVNWPTTPFGGWANVEQFGVTSFNKAQTIRLNLGSTQIPLASEHLTLTGKAGKTDNVLSWYNNEDLNAEYAYVLETSTDYKNWTEIKSIHSGGLGKMMDYQFTHFNAPQTKNYYRVRVADLDNKLKYSNTITLLNGDEAVLIELYPNPAKDVVTLNTNTYKGTTLAITDVQGKTVLSQPLTQAITSVSLKGIATGVYQLSLSNHQGNIHTEKLIVE